MNWILLQAFFKQTEIPNNSPDIFNAVQRIKRVCKILEVCVNQMSVVETMTPLDFLDFQRFAASSIWFPKYPIQNYRSQVRSCLRTAFWEGLLPFAIKYR